MKPQRFINCHQIKVLAWRPMISNINTVTYELARYLSPLSWSDYTVWRCKEFAEIIKLKSIPDSYKLVSFDVKLLFTNATLDSTIDITAIPINCIYDKNELTTNIKGKYMRDFILLCTKNVHFAFDKDIYKQQMVLLWAHH